jgi:serine/threonine protein kinase
MLTPGTVLQNRYRIIRQIGGGGQALVYLAEDINLGSLRAIKELMPDPNASPQERQAAYDQFQREAQTLAGLNHPNLARVWDHFRVGSNAYLVMDYIDRQTLQEIMDQTSGFLPEAAALRWAGQLCDVLDYLHGQHPPIIFRDLKPSNVMLDRSDTVKLIDFGIVRFFKPGKTTDTLTMGTPGYAPLEQHGQGQTDARSDIYALGATLYHLLTQHEPEPAPARVLPGQADPLQPARAYNPRIRPATEAALTKAMAVDPAQRFQSALEMKRALLGTPAPTPSATIPPPAAKHWIQLSWSLLRLVAVFVVLAWFLARRREPGPPTPTVTPTPGPTVSPTGAPIPPTPTAAPTLTPMPPTPTAAPTLTPVPPTPTLQPTTTPTRTPRIPPNIALGKQAKASSVEGNGYIESKAFDRSMQTRWSSLFSDPQWIYVDLGATYPVQQIWLYWEAAYGREYRIELSDDAVNWQTVYHETNGDGGLDIISMSGSGRYVQMYGSQRGTEWGYSLWELEVYSAPLPTPTPTPAPTPTPVP